MVREKLTTLTPDKRWEVAPRKFMNVQFREATCKTNTKEESLPHVYLIGIPVGN
jgi:hypothetical protein